MSSRQLDVIPWAKQKLSGEWSAPSFAAQLNGERLEALVTGFAQLEAMQQVRLLIAALHLPKGEQQELQPLLTQMLSLASSSQDEWLRVTAAAMGRYEGVIDCPGVMRVNPLVRESMEELVALLPTLPPASATLPDFQPQKELYLHPAIRACNMPSRGPHSHSHFSVRSSLDAGVVLTDFALTVGGAMGAAGAGGASTRSLHNDGTVMFRSNRPAEAVAQPKDRLNSGSASAGATAGRHAHLAGKGKAVPREAAPGQAGPKLNNAAKEVGGSTNDGPDGQQSIGQKRPRPITPPPIAERTELVDVDVEEM